MYDNEKSANPTFAERIFRVYDTVNAYFRKHYLIGLMLAVGCFAVVPLVVESRYVLHLFVICFIWMIGNSALNLVLGFRGCNCLAGSALMGVGAYASALLSLRLGWSFWWAFPGAVVISGLFGLALGLIVGRFAPVAVITGTMAFRTICEVTAINWVDLTNGPMALSGIQSPSIGFLGIDRFSRSMYFYFTLLVVCFIMLMIYRIARSPFGRTFMCIKENLELAQSIGVHRYKFDVIAFTILGFLVGVAGVCYAHYITVMSPEFLGSTYMNQMTTMVLAGGRGTLAGPLIGTFVFTMLPEILRATSELQEILYGAAAIAVILWLPYGIVSLPQVLRSKLISERKKDKKEAS